MTVERNRGACAVLDSTAATHDEYTRHIPYYVILAIEGEFPYNYTYYYQSNFVPRPFPAIQRCTKRATLKSLEG